MKDSNDTSIRQHSRVVDQRDHRLPPTWIPRPAERISQSESGRAVHVSGRNRLLARRVVGILAEAKEKVVLASYLLADHEVENAVLAAARRKVRVYILLASEARLDEDAADGEFEKATRVQHQEMLARLGGYALFRSAPHFHAKFVLADPGNGNGVGIVLTANLTREALERNQELAVSLTGKEVDEAFALARWAFWEYAQHELVDPKDRFRAVKPLGSVTHPGPSPGVRATTPKSKGLRDEAARLVEAASRELVVANFGWAEDDEILEFLRVRASEGLAVTVLARVRASQVPALVALAESGAQVFGFKWLHAKALCADGAEALVMSANLQPDGLDHGFELGVRLNGKRAEEVRTRLNEWSKAARWELLASPTLGGVLGEVLVWQKNRLREMTVKAERPIDLGVVDAESADARGDAMPWHRRPLPSGELPEPAHKIVYAWRAQAPTSRA